jgi:hypothetical protein
MIYGDYGDNIMKKNHGKFLILLLFLIIIKVDADENVIIENFFNALNSNDLFPFQYIGLEMTLPENMPLHFIKNDNDPITIDHLEVQEEIKILAKAQMPYTGVYYYLIKRINDDNLWSGWILGTDIIGLNEIENKSGDKGYVKTIGINCISDNNQYIAFHTGTMGSFFILDQMGNIKFQLSHSMLMQEYIDALDGRFIGWATDSARIWFQSNMDALIVCFGFVDINAGTYSLFDSPGNYESFQFALDYNTGDAFYTDYPYQFDSDTGLITAKSGKVFHLFKYNFFTNIEIEICRNIGKGFTIRKKEGSIFYNRDDNPYDE